LCLLLLCGLLLSSFVPAPESAGHATHRGSRGSSFPRIPPNCTADDAKCSPARCALKNVRLRGSIWLGIKSVGVARVGYARVETGLLNRPSVAFVAILVLLRLTLILLGYMNISSLCAEAVAGTKRTKTKNKICDCMPTAAVRNFHTVRVISYSCLNSGSDLIAIAASEHTLK